MCSDKNGFTLVEVMVASMIGAFIAIVAVGTLKAVSASAQMLDENIESTAEVRFASKLIANDLMNLYMDSNSLNSMLVGTIKESDGDLFSSLVLYSVGRAKARIDEPEGDVYEVEYYLVKDEEKSSLMRRLWPNPDEVSTPGGILSVIAEDVNSFVVRYFDGEQWQIDWPEELESIPELVEVVIKGNESGRAKAAMESFIINFVSSAGMVDIMAGDTEEINSSNTGR